MTIKEMREQIGISRAQLCRELEISRRTLEAWENEINPIPPYIENLIIFYLEHREA